jgi:glucosamine 6-phosphate synthetase-like amidotransferase/phosphosugar isomerase protein
MDLVHEALLQQKKVWRKLVDEIPRSGIAQALPPILPNRIILFGVGSSYHAAKLTALTLIRHMPPRLGKAAIQILSCSSNQLGLEFTPSKDDWVIAFSHRGKTESTRRALEYCRKSGAFTIMVAARGADIPASVRLHLPSSDLEKCEAHTVGLTSAICAATLLILGSRAAEVWMKYSRLRDFDLKELKKQDLISPTLLLGEWEGEWIVREIALKLTEIVGVRVPVYGAEEFFHGPSALSERLGTLDHIWYVALSGDLRQSQIHSNVCLKVSRTQMLSWVPALVELQWLTLALA